MIYKFIEMLYTMYGDGYAEEIEEFEYILLDYKDIDLSQNDLFIVWANYIKNSKDFETILNL